MPSDLPPSHAFATVAATLRVDLQGAEVIAAFAADEIPCIVLKGRAFADLLYPGQARPYDDTDLLVPARLRARAGAVLERLGYDERPEVAWIARRATPHSRHWDRVRDDAHVDLHVRLNGTGAQTGRVWDVLDARTVELTVGGQSARGLDRPASGMLCALHLAAHATQAKPQEDLARALRLLSRSEWETAYALAVMLGAEEAFVSGLRFSPAAHPLADELGLTASLSAGRLLQADPLAPSSARTIEKVLSQGSSSARLRALSEVLVPSAQEQRRHHRLARRGRAGLLASYGVRPLRLLALTPRALWAWSRARRAARPR